LGIDQPGQLSSGGGPDHQVQVRAYLAAAHHQDGQGALIAGGAQAV